MAAERIQLRRSKGWRMPASAAKVDRSTKWGNPYHVGRDGTAAECVSRFAQLLEGTSDESFTEAELSKARMIRVHLPELEGKELACWCALDAPCHADVLLRLAGSSLRT